MATSLLVLSRECPDRLGWYTQGAPSSGTSVTVWIHNAVGSQFDEQDTAAYWQNVWAKVEADSAGTPLNVGEVRRIKTYAPSTATFTLATGRGFSNTPTVTMTVGFYKTVPPGTRWGEVQGWTSYINRILRSLRYRRFTLLTLVTDGDMETSGTSNWTASNATLSKITTAANIVSGEQSLRVVNSAANGYARSALLAVAEGDTYSLRASMQVVSGTAVLEAYDETNGASILTESSAYRDWRYLAFDFTVPTDCKSLSIRLKGTEASADVYWENVSLRNVSARQMYLPSWVDSPQAVEGLYESRGGTARGFATLVSGQYLYNLPYEVIVAEPPAANPYKIVFVQWPNTDSLLLVKGLAPYSELSADTDTTTADKDLVEIGACALALRDHQDKRADEYAKDYAYRKAFLPRAERYIGSP